ncbi:acyltransferase family protein [Undibacterium sp. TJN19]|uniref:acyltransferase family protein n=1 Tax=Undibacterium sp. TJN19 TaxID=3413055 RepID=UPI003BF442C4
MSTQHTDYLHCNRFNSLDGLRAISILAVIWHHTAPASVNAVLTSIGAQGVQLFFAISGFLITTLLLREKARNGKLDLKAFYLRRSLRIFPLYYGTLILYIVVVAVLERHTPTGQAFFSNLPYFATYTSNLFVPLDGRVIFYFAWSLAAEEQFYLIWPPLLLLAASGKRAAIILAFTLLVCIGGQLSDNKFLSAVPLPIVMGALLAIALNHEQSYQRLFLFMGQQWSVFIAALCLVISLVTPGVPAFICSLFFTLLVGACVIRDRHPLTALLSLKPVAYIGSISYGMYMLHMLCKNFVVKICHSMGISDAGLGLFVLTTLLAIAVATISFNYYESWFLRWKSRFER